MAGYDVAVPGDRDRGEGEGEGEGKGEGGGASGVTDGGGDLFELEMRNSELRKYRGLDPDGRKEEGDTLTVDCFPDEAIGMALAAGAPIYVERDVWEAAAVPASRSVCVLCVYVCARGARVCVDRVVFRWVDGLVGWLLVVGGVVVLHDVGFDDLPAWNGTPEVETLQRRTKIRRWHPNRPETGRFGCRYVKKDLC